MSVWLHLTHTTCRPELAIQVFKGYYKSDKPDGVIPSGEAEVRHYAMETSISGGIVATICFSLSARLPRLPVSERRRWRRRRRERGRQPRLFFCSGKPMENSGVRILPRFNARRSRLTHSAAICVSVIRYDMPRRGETRHRASRSTSAKPTTQLKPRPMNEYKLLR